jgi:hypothetical protein
MSASARRNRTATERAEREAAAGAVPQVQQTAPEFPSDSEVAPPGATIVGASEAPDEQPSDAASPAIQQNNVATVDGDEVRMVMVEVPIAPQSVRGHAMRGLKDLSPASARTLRRIADALGVEGEKMENGKPVQDSNDALAWLLQKIGAQGRE